MRFDFFGLRSKKEWKEVKKLLIEEGYKEILVDYIIRKLDRKEINKVSKGFKYAFVKGIYEDFNRRYAQYGEDITLDDLKEDDSDVEELLSRGVKGIEYLYKKHLLEGTY